MSSSLFGQTAPVVWVVPGMERVAMDAPAGAGTEAQLKAARGETESFQIVVRAPSGASLTNVNVAVTDLVGPGGGVIPKANLALFREHYVYVGTNSPDWSGSNRPLPTGWYADGLIPFIDPETGQPPLFTAALKAVPFSVAAGKNQPIWVDVSVPRTVPAGLYTGAYTVSSSQGNMTGQISVTVWNITLPLKPSLKSSFLVWQAGSVAARELLRNKLMPIPVNQSEQRQLIDNYGLSSQHLGFWSGADIGNCTMSPAPSVSAFQAAAAAQQPDLYLYDYSADEIGSCSGLYPIIKQWAYNMHQAGVKNLITMAPVPELYDDGSGTGRSAVDIWVMLPKMHDDSMSRVQEVLRKGDAAWSYNTLVQDSYSPKWEIDFLPMDFRIQPGFISQSLSLTGLLYWRVDLWSSDAWNNVYSPGLFATYPGEAQLIYPGGTAGLQGVAPSMRLKWLRDGVEDYEYIELLKKAGEGAWALQVSQSVGPNWTNWTRDTALLENSRRQLGDRLHALNGGGGTLPGLAASPSPVNGASGVPVSATLSWSAATDATSYDVYFGNTATPAMIGQTSGTTYNPGALQTNTTYYWRVIAKNSSGSTSSSLWSFTTVNPQPPASPGNPSPANGSSGVSLTPVLSWSAAADATSYDVYFGTTSNPPQVSQTAGTVYNPGTLQAGATYYWRIVARNSAGSTTSPVWSFVTASLQTPGAPGNPTPASGTAGVALAPTLGWSAGSGATSYEVYFGTTDIPPLVAQTVSTGYAPGNLSAGTRYFWRVVAKNSAGGTTSSMWSFTTTTPSGTPPRAVSVSPAIGFGSQQTFTFNYSSQNGFASGSALFGKNTDGRNACWLSYDGKTRRISLARDDQSFWDSADLGAEVTLQNSQCSIAANQVTVTATSTSLTMSARVVFTSGFTGTKDIYMRADDLSGLTSGYVPMGTWRVAQIVKR